jgi:hypothetical protein
MSVSVGDEAKGDGLLDGMLIASFLEAGSAWDDGRTKGTVTDVWDLEEEKVLGSLEWRMESCFHWKQHDVQYRLYHKGYEDIYIQDDFLCILWTRRMWNGKKIY